MSEEEKDNEATPAPEEHEAEIVKAPDNRVEVSGDLLNEAVSQLKKMAEIRQRDSERQERAIAQMQRTLKRGRILSRYVILCCLIVVVISAGLAYLMWQSAKSEKTTATTLVQVNESLSDATQTIAEETQRQVTSLDNIRVEQERFASELEQELRATREVQQSVVSKVDEQLGAVRQERDQVTGEVRNLLEEKTQFYITKEQELAAEREAIKEAKERSKEEQKELINDTIARLNAMAASLEPESAEAVSDAELDAAVSQAEDVIAEEAPADEITEEMVEEAVEESPAAAEAETMDEAIEEAVEAVEESAETAEGDVTIEWTPAE